MSHSGLASAFTRHVLLTKCSWGFVWACFGTRPGVDRSSGSATLVLNLPLISFVEQNVGDMFPSVHQVPLRPIQGRWGRISREQIAIGRIYSFRASVASCILYMVAACPPSRSCARLSPTADGRTLALTGTGDFGSHHPSTSFTQPFPFFAERVWQGEVTDDR